MRVRQRIQPVSPCGGWGYPTDRDPEKVRDGVLDGLISRDTLHETYGVVLTEKGEVNVDATGSLRSDRRASE